MLLAFLLLLSFGFSANAQTDVTTGYYHIVSKATKRNQYLYNNSFLDGNTNNITLQNATAVTTNNGVWYVTKNNDNTISIVNGDGKPMVAGSNSGSTVVGTYSTLTIGTTSDDGGYRYYYFTEAIDATDATSTNCSLNGIYFITTWTGGPNTAEDLLWRFEPVSTEGKTVYNVKIDGIDGGYVTYEHDGTTENAYNGGFFIASSMDASSLKVYQNGTELTDASVTIENGEIRVSFLQTGYYHIINKDTARPEFIYNNSLAANTNKFTLQSDTQVTTNNGVWYIKRSDKTLSIVNGDGQPMVTGKNSDNGGGLDGTFSTLTIADSTDVAPYRYYLFSEKINCTESNSNCKLSDGTYYITTWSAGTKSHDDMLWRFEPVSTDGKTVYSVDTKDFESLESLSNVYVVYTHDGTTENAYNGGFFIASSIDESNLKVYQNGTALSNAAVDIEDGVIKVKAIVSLGESTDNSTAISKYKGLSVDVKVNRTMTQGQWNTLCFPFTMSDKNFQNLKQYSQIKACKEVKDATMLFEDATSIEAGKPYLVKPTNTLFDTYITGFSDVTMATETTPSTDTGDNDYKFIGVYNQKKFSESEATKSLILVTDGKLVNPVKETTMKALRAYFTYPGTSDGAGVAPRLVIDGVETALTEVISSEEISDGRIYNLRGMYVGNDASSLAKGVYIMNGKKVIIK